MTAVTAVLLIPAEGDPLRLLDDWPHPEPDRPSTRYICAGNTRMRPDGGYGVYFDVERGPEHDCDCCENSLVLAWDGVVHPHGCLRLDPEYNRWPIGVRMILTLGKLGGVGNERLGRLVLLDADGREVTP